MLSASLILWFILLVLAQLTVTNNLSYALALVWCFIVSLVALLFLIDLDLLASSIFAVYSSVFLFLTLFSLYLSSYWASATGKVSSTTAQSLVLTAALVFAALATLGSGPSTGNLGAVGVSHLPWTNLYSLSRETFFSAAGALHFSFYRLFVVETVLVNLYLLLGLIVAVAALAVIRRQSALAAAFVRGAKSSSVGTLRVLAARVQAVKSLRRQVRRKNSTATRTRL